jgi:hypothetical protein
MTNTARALVLSGGLLLAGCVRDVEEASPAPDAAVAVDAAISAAEARPPADAGRGRDDAAIVRSDLDGGDAPDALPRPAAPDAGAADALPLPDDAAPATADARVVVDAGEPDAGRADNSPPDGAPPAADSAPTVECRPLDAGVADDVAPPPACGGRADVPWYAGVPLEAHDVHCSCATRAAPAPLAPPGPCELSLVPLEAVAPYALDPARPPSWMSDTPAGNLGPHEVNFDWDDGQCPSGVTMVFDEADRVTRLSTFCLGGASSEDEATYDAAGHVTSREHDDFHALGCGERSYTADGQGFDAEGRLTAVSSSRGAGHHATGSYCRFDAAGRVEQLSAFVDHDLDRCFGNGDWRIVTEDWRYDERGRVAAHATEIEEGEEVDRSGTALVYDDCGRIVGSAECGDLGIFGCDAAGDRGTTFTYDDAGRVAVIDLPVEGLDGTVISRECVGEEACAEVCARTVTR